MRTHLTPKYKFVSDVEIEKILIQKSNMLDDILNNKLFDIQNAMGQSEIDEDIKQWITKIFTTYKRTALTQLKYSIRKHNKKIKTDAAISD